MGIVNLEECPGCRTLDINTDFNSWHEDQNKKSIVLNRTCWQCEAEWVDTYEFTSREVIDDE